MNSQPYAGPSIEEQTLFAIRAIGILFIRSTVAYLVGALIVGAGYLLLIFGLSSGNSRAVMVGSVVIGIGLLVTAIWEIVVVVGANRELRKSGGVTGGLGEWLGVGVR